MSAHTVSLNWELGQHDFDYRSYSRNHLWQFRSPSDHTIDVQASAAAEYLGDDECIDPEQAFVASIASCHMLTFLAIASRKRLTVIRYSDQAAGWPEKNVSSVLAITRVELRPVVEFEPSANVSTEQLEKLHYLSHKDCFIANSVNTRIDEVTDTGIPHSS